VHWRRCAFRRLDSTRVLAGGRQATSRSRASAWWTTPGRHSPARWRTWRSISWSRGSRDSSAGGSVVLG